jgi:hypothetical protein
MQAISDDKKDFFIGLLTGISDWDPAKKIDNTPGFMPLHIERIGYDLAGHGAVYYSMAHYGEQNGDLMRDPDVILAITHDGIYPMSYRNDYAGFLGEYIEVENGRLNCVDEKMQSDLCGFVETWLDNIQEQQKL